MASRLTARFVGTVTKPGRYGDGAGLHLFVKPTGRKSFVQRLTINGKRVDRGLGSPEWMPLTKVREIAIENWLTVRRGGNPWSGSDAARAESARGTGPTVREAVATVLGLQAPELGAKSISAWKTQGAIIVDAIGEMRIDEVTAADCLRVLRPIWTDRHATAKRVRAKLSAIMEWAIASEHRADNPAGPGLAKALPRVAARTENRASDPHAAIGQILASVPGAAPSPEAAAALALVAHTGVRSAEARGARWSEFDLAGWVWTLPPERSKMRRPHRVALTDATVAILKSLPRNGELVFPGRNGRELADTTLARTWRAAGGTGTVHGVRAAMRSWCEERAVGREVAEAILGHVVKGVEGVYQRADLLDRRAPVMAEWSAYIAT